MPIRCILALLTCATGAMAADTAILAHGDMAITIPLPSGTETGTRFDAGSMALRATWRGRALFGSYTHLNYPETNTAAGFAEEYDNGDRSLPPGFAGAGEGGAFLKLAVGALRRGPQPYVSWKTQPVAKRGTWHAERGPDWAELRWDSPVVGTTSCSLVRRLALRDDGFSVERRLINRGRTAIATEHYAHHFLAFDGRPLATGYEVELGYTPAPPATIPAPLRLAGRLVTIGPLPAKWTPTDAAALVLPGPAEAEADAARTITVRHRGLGLALRMVADRTPARTIVYAAPQVICPESFVDLLAPPGGEVAWRTDYTVSEEPR